MIYLFKSKRFNDGRCTYRNTGSSHLNWSQKAQSSDRATRERGLLFNEEKRRNSKIVVLMRMKTKVTLVHEMAREAPLLLAKRYPLFEDKKTFKKSKDGEGKNEYFTDVDDPNQQGVYCWWFRVSVWKWIRHPFWLILMIIRCIHCGLQKQMHRAR